MVMSVLPVNTSGYSLDPSTQAQMWMSSCFPENKSLKQMLFKVSIFQYICM